MSHHLAIVCRVLSQMTPAPDTAAQVHVAAARALMWAGYAVHPEYGAETGGRIDLVVERDGWRAAIEIDARKPRARSLIKLRGFDGAKICAVRGVSPMVPEGIDAAVGIRVRTATQAERDDRRTVSRMRSTPR